MPNARKVAQVDQLTTSLTQKHDVVLLGFDRTSHIALESLRRSLRQTQATMQVVKTSLMSKALERVEALADFTSKALPIRESTAVVHMGTDWSSSLKAIFEFAKKETSVFFKIGFLDKVVYERSSLERLAQLPSKTELLGKVIGSLKSPVNRLDYAVKFPMTYFVNVLKARSAQSNG